MCLPSSLLKAGSQLHGSRGSAEAEGRSPVRGKAGGGGPAGQTWGVPGGLRLRGAARRNLQCPGRRWLPAGSRLPCHRHCTPRGPPGSLAGAGPGCVHKHPLQKCLQPRRGSSRKDSSTGGGRRHSPSSLARLLPPLEAPPLALPRTRHSTHPSSLSTHVHLLTAEPPEGRRPLLLLCPGGECHAPHSGLRSCISWGLKPK